MEKNDAVEPDSVGKNPVDESGSQAGAEETEDDTVQGSREDRGKTDKENQQENGSDAVFDEVVESLEADGFSVFRGRKFVSIRENGTIAPNSTLATQRLDDAKSAALSYNEDSNEIAIVPLEVEVDREGICSIRRTEDRVKIAASQFLKDFELMPEETVRYRPEWRKESGSADIPGRLIIDLDQDGEVVSESDE